MKKVILAIVVLFVTGLAFCGCSGKNSEENRVIFDSNSRASSLFEVVDAGEQYLEFGDKTMRRFDIKNLSNNTFEWVKFDLVFVNDKDEIVKEDIAGTLGSFAPKEVYKVFQEPHDVKDVTKCFVTKVTEVVYED